MKVVVSDTSPIRSLHYLRLLAILPELFAEVVIPPSVLRELENPESELVPIPRAELAALVVVAPTDQARIEELKLFLDSGESESLALALELGVSVVLMDEEQGRAMAQKLGLSTMGVIGILLRAKQANLVAEIKTLLFRLRDENNFHISDKLMHQALTLANESA